MLGKSKINLDDFREQESALTTAVAALPDVTGGTIDTEAATSPAGREDSAKGTNTHPNAETRLEAFYAAFRALLPDERKAAAKWTAEEVKRCH